MNFLCIFQACSRLFSSISFIFFIFTFFSLLFCFPFSLSTSMLTKFNSNQVIGLWCLMKLCVKCKDRCRITCCNRREIWKILQTQNLGSSHEDHRTRYSINFCFYRGLPKHFSIILSNQVDTSSFSNLLLHGHSLFLILTLDSYHAIQGQI